MNLLLYATTTHLASAETCATGISGIGQNFVAHARDVAGIHYSNGPDVVVALQNCAAAVVAAYQGHCAGVIVSSYADPTAVLAAAQAAKSAFDQGDNAFPFIQT